MRETCLVVLGTLAVLAGCASPAETASVAALTPTIPTTVTRHCSLGCPIGAPASNKTIQHSIYTLSNNSLTKFADWVAYVVVPNFIGGPERARIWASDPDLDPSETLEKKDFERISDIGMERGHQAPLEAFTNSPHWAEANYLSNITPQLETLNGGRWARLEAAERQLAQRKNADVFVVTGPLYQRTMPKLPRADEPHFVPSGYWKVISMRSGGAIGFVFEQEARAESFCAGIRPVKDIETIARLNLFPDVSENPPELNRSELGC